MPDGQVIWVPDEYLHQTLLVNKALVEMMYDDLRKNLKNRLKFLKYDVD